MYPVVLARKVAEVLCSCSQKIPENSPKLFDKIEIVFKNLM